MLPAGLSPIVSEEFPKKNFEKDAGAERDKNSSSPKISSFMGEGEGEWHENVEMDEEEDEIHAEHRHEERFNHNHCTWFHSRMMHHMTESWNKFHT